LNADLLLLDFQVDFPGHMLPEGQLTVVVTERVFHSEEFKGIFVKIDKRRYFIAEDKLGKTDLN
jgi:hypothetical protein